MQCHVHLIRKTIKGFVVAHVQVGDYFGDVPADSSLQNKGPAELRTIYRVHQGRLQSALRVYPIEGGK